MNAITGYPSSLQSPYGDTDLSAGFASREQSLSAYKGMDAGLTIQTREGDVVTLSANSLAEFQAYEYNSRGVVQGENGTQEVSSHTREISLYTEDAFSFSVVGDLNEQELADIEAIIKGIDGIIGEMARGDMEGAVGKALSMGGYDSVAMFKADITVERGYAYSESIQGRAMGDQSRPDLMAPQGDLMVSPGPDDQQPSQALHVPSFIDKMAQFLEEQEKTLLAKAAQPLEELFNHHIEGLEDEAVQETPDEDGTPSLAQALRQAREDVALMISDRVKDIFRDFLDELA